jgi:hypothetical protein
MILIVSSYIDPHVEVVGDELQKLGLEYMRIDLGAFFRDFDIDYRLIGGNIDFTARNRHTGKAFSRQDISGVWWRRIASIYEDSAPVSESNADARETGNFIKNLIESFPDSYFPLGHPRHIRPAENKLLQMDIASRIGFYMPATCFSNSLTMLNTYIRTEREYVVKSMSLHSAMKDGDELSFYTMAFSGDDLRERIGENKEGACFVQDRIHRRYDVRLNVLPHVSVGAKINLDNLPAGEVDWRPTTMDHVHEIIEPPSDIEAKCRTMLAELDIPWGAFDFIVDDAGRWWFLEVNPNGQWLWIQQKTGANLARHFANAIAINAMEE